MNIKKKFQEYENPKEQKQNYVCNEYSQLLAFSTLLSYKGLQLSPFVDMSVLLNTPISKFTSKYEHNVQFDISAFKEDYYKATSQIFLFQADLCEKLKKYSIIGKLAEVISHLVQYSNRISQFCFHKIKALNQRIQNDKKQINEFKNHVPKSHCENCGDILTKEKIKNIKNQLLQLPKFYDCIHKDSDQEQDSSNSDEIRSLQCFLISQEKMKNKLFKLQTNLDQRKYDISTCLIELGQFKNKVIDYSNRRVKEDEVSKFNGQKMVFQIGQYFYQNIKQVQSQIKQIKKRFNPKMSENQEIQVDTISTKIQKEIQLKKKKLQIAYRTQIEQLKQEKIALTDKVSQFQIAYAKYIKNQEKNDNLLIMKGINELQLKKTMEKMLIKTNKLEQDLQIAKKLLNKANISYSFNEISKQNLFPLIQTTNLLHQQNTKQSLPSHTINKIKFINSSKNRFGKQRRKTSILNQLYEHITQISKDEVLQEQKNKDYLNQQQSNNNLQIFLDVVYQKIDPMQFIKKQQKKVYSNLKSLKNKSKRNLTVAQSLYKKNAQQIQQNYKQKIQTKNFKRTKSKQNLKNKVNTESKSQQNKNMRYQSQIQASKQKHKKLEALYKSKKRLNLFRSKGSDSKMISSYNQLQKSKELKTEKEQSSTKNMSLHQIVNLKSQINSKKGLQLAKKRKKRNFSQDYEQKKYIIDYIPGCEITQNQQKIDLSEQVKEAIFSKQDEEQMFGVIQFNKKKVFKKKAIQKENNQFEKIVLFQKQKNNSKNSLQKIKQKTLKIQHDILQNQELSYSTDLYASLATLHIMDKQIYKQIRQFLERPFLEQNSQEKTFIPSLKSIIGYLLTQHRKCYKRKKENICEHMQNFLKKIKSCKNPHIKSD